MSARLDRQLLMLDVTRYSRRGRKIHASCANLAIDSAVHVNGVTFDIAADLSCLAEGKLSA